MDTFVLILLIFCIFLSVAYTTLKKLFAVFYILYCKEQWWQNSTLSDTQTNAEHERITEITFNMGKHPDMQFSNSSESVGINLFISLMYIPKWFALSRA